MFSHAINNGATITLNPQENNGKNVNVAIVSHASFISELTGDYRDPFLEGEVRIYNLTNINALYQEDSPHLRQLHHSIVQNRTQEESRKITHDYYRELRETDEQDSEYKGAK
ncbi:hypothetical protein M426DRAFT_28671 [Hypoxylon sp. CI-4A]|nr:hypothetical protein M426DRAFT_28671 [Hypoxylon sp. CI-4A]